ncbi:MAG: hypothetical protein WCO56_16685 [Verrucomicrobiota bacterium]
MKTATAFAALDTRIREFIAHCCAHPLTTGETAAQCDRVFNELALAAFALQVQYNQAYAVVCQRRGIKPGEVQAWGRIPAIPTAAFKELDFTCLLPEDRARVFHSSGTSAQQPSRHFHCAASLALYEASLEPWFARHLLPEAASPVADRKLLLVSLTPPGNLAPHSSLVHMVETVMRRLGAPESQCCGCVASAGEWELDPERLLAALRQSMECRQPVVLLGTAFNFVHLLDYFAQHDLRLALAPGSRVMETGGYKGRSREVSKAELHAGISRSLGVPAAQIIGEYGMCELGSQAYDATVAAPSPDGARVYQFPPWCRVRITSPESGQEVPEGQGGIVQLFDLANLYSVAAIQTGDLGIRRGQGFELLGRVGALEPRGCSLMIKDMNP